MHLQSTNIVVLSLTPSPQNASFSLFYSLNTMPKAIFIIDNRSPPSILTQQVVMGVYND